MLMQNTRLKEINSGVVIVFRRLGTWHFGQRYLIYVGLMSKESQRGHGSAKGAFGD